MTITAPITGLYQVPFVSAGLFYVDINGNALGSAVWTPKATDTLRCSDNLVERLSRPTGARYATAHHIDEQHIIEIGGYMDLSFVMQRNQQFVFWVAWQASDEGVPLAPYQQNAEAPWWARTYYGVTFISLENAGRGPDPFSMAQRLRAQFYTQANGTGSPSGPITS